MQPTPRIAPIQLSPAQVSEYHQQGFIRLGRVLDDQQVAALMAYLATLTPRPQDKGTLFFTQLRGENPTLGDFAAHGPQVEAMAALIGPNLRCWFDQFVVKPPGIPAQVFPWHQDNGYTAPRPDNNVTVWIALDETTLENGCIWALPGSHKGGLIPHKKKSEDSWHIEVDVAGNGEPVLLKSGEAVAFTGYTLHRSLDNRTAQTRRAFFLEYCDADAVFHDGVPINQRQGPDLFAGQLCPVIRGTSIYAP
jgi:ectoine hydroxylase-related dioxygenase (phytanoyl-CoA dioxygenase family)